MPESIVIEEIPIPSRPGAASFAGYAQALAVRNAHQAQVMGPAARFIDPVEALPSYQDQAHMRARIFAGWLDGELVAHALLRWSAEPGTRIAWFFGDVLPGARRRGVGTALIDHVEGVARALGRQVIQTFALHEATAGGDRLPSPTGFGSLPLHDPGVRFLRGRGYELSQVQRMSLLQLPPSADHIEMLDGQAKTLAGDAYEMVTWTGPTAANWLADLAVLNSRMESDAPRGKLVTEPQEWDTERIRAQEAQYARSGRLVLTAAALHRPTGHLAGFTRLSVPVDRTRPALQQETLVLREHRGHRLGLHMKLANLRQLMEASPGSTMIVASNAEDNLPMLNVNETIGFVPIASEGAWKKSLVEPVE